MYNDLLSQFSRLIWRNLAELSSTDQHQLWGRDKCRDELSSLPVSDHFLHFMRVFKIHGDVGMRSGVIHEASGSSECWAS